jgi:Uma2 family endonuclease
MSSITTRTGPLQAPDDAIPPLENGDRLSRSEFERRYGAMPELKKAELIEGVVYITTRVPYRGHAQPHAHAVGWLGVYAAGTLGCAAADSTSLRLALDNEFQPDALLMIEPDQGGQARISEDDFVEGAPELVAEVASSRVSIELNAKFQVYRRNGVREYVVRRVRDRRIDWYVLQDDEFLFLEPDEDGRYRSRVFPGLWLDAEAMIRDDLAKVLDVLREGLATPEHEAFVKELAVRRNRS